MPRARAYSGMPACTPPLPQKTAVPPAPAASRPAAMAAHLAAAMRPAASRPAAAAAHSAAALLLAAALFLTGCAPEEKTMLLPSASPAQSETEGETAAPDYTVKKIYTYSYDTLSGLGKSAFLSGCGENEIHILSLNGQEDKRTLEYRQVDYRYGFYDVAGDFREIPEGWESWNNPGAGEMEGDLYIDVLLPSPDGKQLLVYIRSAFWDKLTVWLYTFGVQEPLLLYDGSDGLAGSFSPDGRWVVFDATGACTSSFPFIPVYDCSQTASREDAYWWVAETASRLLVPDQVLLKPDLTQEDEGCQIWDARLLSDSGEPRLMSLLREGGGLLSLMESPALPNLEIRPDASLFTEGAAFTGGPACTKWYLSGYERTPYPLYRYTADGNAVYYLSNPTTLFYAGLTDYSNERVLSFPNLIWDFQPLASGDILAVLIQETENGLELNSSDEHSMEQYIQENGIPTNLQWYWGILSADLYLYPQGASEGQLLYKNLQNLTGMEYDEKTRRILLETYEGQDMTRRRCIILEM